MIKLSIVVSLLAATAVNATECDQQSDYQMHCTTPEGDSLPLQIFGDHVSGTDSAGRWRSGDRFGDELLLHSNDDGQPPSSGPGLPSFPSVSPDDQ
jgi:hypothetical protein